MAIAEYEVRPGIVEAGIRAETPFVQQFVNPLRQYVDGINEQTPLPVNRSILTDTSFRNQVGVNEIFAAWMSRELLQTNFPFEIIPDGAGRPMKVIGREGLVSIGAVCLAVHTVSIGTREELVAFLNEGLNGLVDRAIAAVGQDPIRDSLEQVRYKEGQGGLAFPTPYFTKSPGPKFDARGFKSLNGLLKA